MFVYIVYIYIYSENLNIKGEIKKMKYRGCPLDDQNKLQFWRMGELIEGSASWTMQGNILYDGSCERICRKACCRPYRDNATMYAATQPVCGTEWQSCCCSDVRGWCDIERWLWNCCWKCKLERCCCIPCLAHTCWHTKACNSQTTSDRSVFVTQDRWVKAHRDIGYAESDAERFDIEYLYSSNINLYTHYTQKPYCIFKISNRETQYQYNIDKCGIPVRS